MERTIPRYEDYQKRKPRSNHAKRDIHPILDLDTSLHDDLLIFGHYACQEMHMTIPTPAPSQIA